MNVRSWPLYVALGALTATLYASGLLAGREVLAPTPETSTAPAIAKDQPLPSLDVQRVLQVGRERPAVMVRLAVWTTAGVLIAFAGVILGVLALIRRRPREPARPARVPYLWPFADALRLLALMCLVILLLPFVHLAVMAWNVTQVQDHRAWSLIGMFILHAMLLLFVWGFAASRGVSVAQMFGLVRERIPGAIAQGLKGYAIAFPWIFGLLALVATVGPKFGIHPSAETIHELIFLEQRGPVLVMTVLLACIVGPIAEEIVFRGILYSTLRRRCSRSMAMLLSGSLFAAVHTNAIGFLPIVALGALLADRYERTGSLASSIAIHVVHNTLLMGLGMTMKEFL
jgi:membrane protease YdiL (CAAX protease family)